MLRPVMVVCIVIRAIDAFRTFDIVWTISGGGPARATEVFSIYAYVEAFQFLNLARGSAAAVIGALIIVVFALLLYRVLNRFVEVSKCAMLRSHPRDPRVSSPPSRRPERPPSSRWRRLRFASCLPSRYSG